MKFQEIPYTVMRVVIVIKRSGELFVASKPWIFKEGIFSSSNEENIQM